MRKKCKNTRGIESDSKEEEEDYLKFENCGSNIKRDLSVKGISLNIMIIKHNFLKFKSSAYSCFVLLYKKTRLYILRGMSILVTHPLITCLWGKLTPN